MSKHIYIDESVRINYIVPLVIVETEKIKEIRKSLRQFVKNNHKNIHMFKANKAFKNRILKEVMSYDLEIVIIEDLNFRFRKSLSRQICLRSGFEYISKFDINRIVLDRSNSQEKDLITWEDYDAWIRFSRISNNFECINKILGSYTYDNENTLKIKRQIFNINLFRKRYLVNEYKKKSDWYYYALFNCHLKEKNYKKAFQFFNKVNFNKLRILSKLKLITYYLLSKFKFFL